jgi:hypothetical protein
MIEQRADSVTIRGAPMLSETYRAVCMRSRDVATTACQAVTSRSWPGHSDARTTKQWRTSDMNWPRPQLISHD